jgi:hypothetical protein
MTKISLEIDEDLNRQIKQYALDKYGRTHGMQQKIIRDALVAYLKEMSKPAKPIEVESTVEEIPKEPTKAEAKPKAKRGRPPKKGKRGEFGNDAAATLKVKELWAGGERNVSKIASQFPSYTKRQVEYWIKKNLSKEAATG